MPRLRWSTDNQEALDAPNIAVQPPTFDTMSDSDPSQKKPGVPSWQLSSKDTTPAEADTDAESEAGAKAETQRESPSRESVIEQAKRFLQEDEVRNASTDKKISFLESKGLTSEEIQTLLGVTRNPEASAQAPAHTQDQVSSTCEPLLASY
jgi:hypothetical protein